MIRALMACAVMMLSMPTSTYAGSGPEIEKIISETAREERYIIREGAEIYDRKDGPVHDCGHLRGTVEIIPALSDTDWTVIATCDGIGFMHSADLAAEQPDPERNLRSLGTFRLTYYDPHSCCGSGNGITASGHRAEVGRTIAISKKYAPLGAHVIINGHEYVVDDRGVTGRTVDILVSTHKEAKKKGVERAEVYLVEERYSALAKAKEAAEKRR